MHIDFSIAFHLVPMLNFLDVFLVRVDAAHCGEYLVGEPGLDILFPFPHLPLLSPVGFIHVTYILFYFINFILFMSIYDLWCLYGSNAHNKNYTGFEPLRKVLKFCMGLTPILKKISRNSLICISLMPILKILCRVQKPL